MVNSMTGFAALTGQHEGASWAWELRGVNARGLDLRLRLPEGCEALEQGLRKSFAAGLERGNVSLTLRLQRDAGKSPLQLDPEQLARVIAAARAAEAQAEEAGLTLRHSSVGELLGLRGVLEAATPDDGDDEALQAALLQDVAPLLNAFQQMRAGEGKALGAILAVHLNEVEAQVAETARIAEARKDQVAANLQANLATVMDGVAEADPARVAQELALLAVKADIREEIDRLKAHIGAARELLAAKGAIGRKLDFLMQEFNREANTLCSKSQFTDLTRVGLDLKATINQMREQVQNVE